MGNRSPALQPIPHPGVKKTYDYLTTTEKLWFTQTWAYTRVAKEKKLAINLNGSLFIGQTSLGRYSIIRDFSCQ